MYLFYLEWDNNIYNNNDIPLERILSRTGRVQARRI